MVEAPVQTSNAKRLRSLAIGLCFILLLIAFAVAWNNGLRDQLVARNFGSVEPGLFRSGQISARLIGPTLSSNHITQIICLSPTGANPKDVAAEIKAASDLGVARQLYPLSGDGTGSIDIYADAVASVARARRENKTVLVHCVAGAQRTGGVIAVYRLLVEHIAPSQALAEMRRFGHDPTANPHLIEYLNQHMAELAQRLVDRGVIPKIPDPIPLLRPDSENAH